MLSKDELLSVLKDCNWVKSFAAERIGVDEKSIRRWCKHYKINSEFVHKQKVVADKGVEFARKVNLDNINTNDREYNVLAIGDIQAPFQEDGYLDFLLDVKKRFKCNKIVNIGDEVDFHALSFHTPDPDGMGKVEEFQQAMKFMKLLYKAFPVASACTSNHTARPYRIAFEAGIPTYFLRTYREFMQAPRGWQWYDRVTINNVIYQHGTGYSGAMGHVKAAIENRQSTVIGHLHSGGGVNYLASHNDLIFGANVGCGIDARAYAFKYGRDCGKKPTLGCGVVLGGKEAFFIPMNLGSRVEYKA